MKAMSVLYEEIAKYCKMSECPQISSINKKFLDCNVSAIIKIKK